MSKSTKAKTPKATAVSEAKVAQTSETTLSDPVLAAALQAIKEPATPVKSQNTKTASTPGAPSKAKKDTVNRSALCNTTTAHHPPSQELINQMVEEAAYYLAEKRNFDPGLKKRIGWPPRRKSSVNSRRPITP